MRQIDIVVKNIVCGAMSSRGTCIDLYDYFAHTIDDEGNGRYEFQEWGFSLEHAADKVRRDYIKHEKMYSRDTGSLVFVYFLMEEGEEVKLTRKKVIFPKNFTHKEKFDFLNQFEFPKNV